MDMKAPKDVTGISIGEFIYTADADGIVRDVDRSHAAKFVEHGFTHVEVKAKIAEAPSKKKDS